MLKRSLFSCAAIALLIAALGVPSAATAEGWDVKWSNGFKFENEEKGHYPLYFPDLSTQKPGRGQDYDSGDGVDPHG